MSLATGPNSVALHLLISCPHPLLHQLGCLLGFWNHLFSFLNVSPFPGHQPHILLYYLPVVQLTLCTHVHICLYKYRHKHKLKTGANPPLQTVITSSRSFNTPDSILCMMSIGVPIWGSKSRKCRNTTSTIAMELALPARKTMKTTGIIVEKETQTVFLGSCLASSPKYVTHYPNMMLHQTYMA